jgi:hypothetical protein
VSSRRPPPHRTHPSFVAFFFATCQKKRRGQENKKKRTRRRLSQHNLHNAAAKMALKPGFMYKFPWEDMGTFKYLLFVPFDATVALGLDDADNWAYHMLTIAAIRYVHAQCWISLSRVGVVGVQGLLHYFSPRAFFCTARCFAVTHRLMTGGMFPVPKRTPPLEWE